MSTCKYFKDYILHLLYRLLQFCCLWKNSLVLINFNCVKKKFKIHTLSYKFLFFHKGEKNQPVTLSMDHKLLKFILTEEQFICQLPKPLGHVQCPSVTSTQPRQRLPKFQVSDLFYWREDRSNTTKGRSREGGSHKSVGGRRMWCGRWEAVTPLFSHK